MSAHVHVCSSLHLQAHIECAAGPDARRSPIGRAPPRAAGRPRLGRSRRGSGSASSAAALGAAAPAAAALGAAAAEAPVHLRRPSARVGAPCYACGLGGADYLAGIGRVARHTPRTVTPGDVVELRSCPQKLSKSCQTGQRCNYSLDRFGQLCTVFGRCGPRSANIRPHLCICVGNESTFGRHRQSFVQHQTVLNEFCQIWARFAEHEASIGVS